VATLFQLGLELKVDKAVSGINRVDRKLSGLQKQGQKLGKVLKGAFVLTGAVVAIRSVTRAFTALADAARAGEQSAAKLQSVLSATGFAAGQTTVDLENMVQALESVTLFNDDELRNSAAQLLTFRQVTGDTFERTLKAAADLSTVLDQDLRSSIIMLGKATSDPVAQMTALSRVGIILSDVQKTQIKRFAALGDTASAAAVILKEVENQVGGAAAGANIGLSGAVNELGKAWDDMLEQMSRTGPISTATIAITGLATALIRAIQGPTELDHVIIQLDKIQEKIAKLIKDNTSPTGLFNVRESNFVDARLEELRTLEAGYKAFIDEAKGITEAEQRIIDALPTPRTSPIFDLNTVVVDMAVSTDNATEATARLGENWKDIDRLVGGTGKRWGQEVDIMGLAWDEAIRNMQDTFSQFINKIFTDIRSVGDLLGGLGNALISIGSQAASASLFKELGIGQFATGGVVGGPVGAPQLALVHGGETIRTPQQESGRGPISITFHIQETNDAEATARAVRRQILETLRENSVGRLF